MNNLHFLLKKRIGWFVPCQTKHILMPFELRSNIKCNPVLPNNLKQNEAVAKYMMDNCYKRAPLPRALNLSSSEPPIRNFMLREMNMYLSSGNSCYFTNPTYDDEIIKGAGGHNFYFYCSKPVFVQISIKQVLLPFGKKMKTIL